MITKSPVGIFILNDKNQILLGLRDDGKGWCAPGGKTEAGEEPIDAIVRELREETNLEIDKAQIRFLGSCNTFDTPDNVKSFMKSNLYLSYIKYSGTSLQTSEEMLEYKWVIFDEALKLNLFYPTKSSLQRFKAELRGE